MQYNKKTNGCFIFSLATGGGKNQPFCGIETENKTGCDADALSPNRPEPAGLRRPPYLTVWYPNVSADAGPVVEAAIRPFL